jgi:hypothetical protein
MSCRPSTVVQNVADWVSDANLDRPPPVHPLPGARSTRPAQACNLFDPDPQHIMHIFNQIASPIFGRKRAQRAKSSPVTKAERLRHRGIAGHAR